MRPSNFTAALLAVTLALPASAYSQPTMRQGNPLSSIFGCDAGGNKQTGGAVIGGLVGGVLGNNLAKNERGLGTVLGAAAPRPPPQWSASCAPVRPSTPWRASAAVTGSSRAATAWR